MSEHVLVLKGEDAVQALLQIAATIPPMPPDECLSIGGAAKFLGVSSDTLSGLAHAGDVPCRNFGTKGKANFRFSKNALSEWLAKGKK